MTRPAILGAGQAMRALRIEAGLTQDAVADARGVTRQTISASEIAGDAVSVASLRAVAKVLGYEVEIRVWRTGPRASVA